MVEQGLKLFVTSFCEEGDYLPNWRYYGGVGAGYSIGFKGCYLKPKDEEFKEGSRIFSKVFYNQKYRDEKNQHSDLFRYINKIFQYADEENEEWYINYPGVVANRLLLILPVIKNSDYMDEKEWRTVFNVS